MKVEPVSKFAQIFTERTARVGERVSHSPTDTAFRPTNPNTTLHERGLLPHPKSLSIVTIWLRLFLTTLFKLSPCFVFLQNDLSPPNMLLKKKQKKKTQYKTKKRTDCLSPNRMRALLVRYKGLTLAGSHYISTECVNSSHKCCSVESSIFCMQDGHESLRPRGQTMVVRTMAPKQVHSL